MRELELAIHPPIEPMRLRAGRRVAISLPRIAVLASVAAHVVAGYALTLHKWGEPKPAPPVADFFLFEMPVPRSAERVVEPTPEARAPEVEQRQPAPLPPPRAAEASPQEPTVVIEPPAVSELAPIEETLPPPLPFVDFDEERRRAASEVVDELARESEYLTFTLDDVAPPRAASEPKPKRSIFDGGGGADFGGRSVGTLGQQRTKLGRKVAEFCNALTGGFGVSFLGFGLFSACASPDGGPTGLFPEVRPAYLDLMPECVDTRDTAPALALEAPFPTVKCRLVRRDRLEEQP